MNEIEAAQKEELSELINKAHEIGFDIVEYAIQVLFKNDSIDKLKKVKDPSISELALMCRGFAKWQETFGEDFEYMLRSAEILDEVLDCITDGSVEDEKAISDRVTELQEIARIQRETNEGATQ